MKLITVRELTASPAAIWSELPERQEMVIANNVKPIGLLTPLASETLEESVSRFTAHGR